METKNLNEISGIVYTYVNFILYFLNSLVLPDIHCYFNIIFFNNGLENRDLIKLLNRKRFGNSIKVDDLVFCINKIENKIVL